MAHPAELSLLLHRALESGLVRLLELSRVEGWQEDPEGLHQVRVASRRVRAVLDLVDSELYPGFRRHERRLRRLTKALGATRELDVHSGILEALKERDLDPVHEAVIEHVQEELNRKRRKAGRSMPQTLRRTSLEDLSTLLEKPDLPVALVQPDLPKAVWACLEPWIRRVEDPLPPLLEQERIEELHKLRIQVKRLRYTLEVLEPAFPAPLEDWLQRLKGLQTVLGNHHDHATLEALLWDVHGRLTANQRAVLASAALDLLGLVVEDRRVHFDRFRGIAQTYRESLLFFNLKQALWLGSPRVDGAPA